MLTAKPFFPTVGAVFSRSMQATAIRQIYNYLLSVQSKKQLEGEEKNVGLNEAAMLVGN